MDETGVGSEVPAGAAFETGVAWMVRGFAATIGMAVALGAVTAAKAGVTMLPAGAFAGAVVADVTNAGNCSAVVVSLAVSGVCTEVPGVSGS